MFQNPQPSDFMSYYLRDFNYGTDVNTQISTTDIANAMQMTNISINQALWTDQASYNVGYLLLSAHFLCLNIIAAQGIGGGQFDFNEQNKSVGNINQAFTIPPRITDNPYWAQFYTTRYGAQYMNLLLPQLCGQMMVVHGQTLP